MELIFPLFRYLNIFKNIKYLFKEKMLRELSTTLKTPKNNRPLSSSKIQTRSHQLSYACGSTSSQTITKSPIISLSKTPKNGLIGFMNQENLQTNYTQRGTLKKNNSVKDNFIPNLKEIKKENTKTFFHSIDPSIPLNTSTPNTVDVDNLKNLEQIISSIKEQGFEKFEKELNNKLKIKAKLEKSIETLKKKIAIHNNSKKNVKNENVKEIIKIQNLKNVSHRYKSIGNGIKKYQKEIPNVWIILIF